MSLSLSKFLALSGYTQSQTNTAYIQFALDSLYNTILENTGLVDSLSVQTIDIQGRNLDLLKTNAWHQGGEVYQVNITNGGSDYTFANVSFSSGNAKATAEIIDGSITKIKITSGGFGYSTAPTITITGNGTNATATCLISPELTVKRGRYGVNAVLEDLTLNKDYYLKTYLDTFHPSLNNPVVAIQLPNTSDGVRFGFFENSNILRNTQFFRVSGVYGWSDGLPSDLENLLYELLKTKLERNANNTASGGKGIANKEQAGDLSISYSQSSNDIESASKLSYDILADPSVVKLLDSYSQWTRSNIRFP